MPRGYLPLLVLLAAIWGSSYLFIKVAVEEIEPSAMVMLRLILAAAVLWGVLALQLGRRGAVAAVRGTWRHALVLGVINASLPFWLISWGEKYIDSGVAAIANSTVPIFVALMAIRVHPGERSSGARLAGILVGLAGVGVLTGVHPEGGWWAVAGTLAVVASSVCYAASNLYAQTRFPARTSPLVIATGTITVGALLMIPPGVVQLPGTVPSGKAIGSVVVLGLVGTSIAYLIHYRIVRTYGSARASLVTYLLPAFALLYGATILDEPLRLTALLGLALILAGIGLGSGLVRPPKRATAAAGP